MANNLRTRPVEFSAQRDPKTGFFCIACAKDMNPKKPCRAVHLVDGGGYALHFDDEEKYVPDGGDVGCHPIGNDCAKKLGLEFTFPPELWPSQQ